MTGMLAVVAAAGRGTRFLPWSKTLPKELLPLHDRPVIHHLVEEIAAAGIPHVVIVTRPETRDLLRRYFSRDSDWDNYLENQRKSHLLHSLYELMDRVKVSYQSQQPDLPYGNGSPLLAVRDRLTTPTVYLYGDDVILEDNPGDSLHALLRLYQAKEPLAVAGAARVPRENISQLGSIAYRSASNNLVDYIVEKPEAGEAPSDYTPIGRLVLSPAIVPILEELCDELDPGSELWMTDALSALAGAGPVLAPPVKGQWLTTGDPVNLLRTSLAFSRAASSS
jgi:UTP--glucose-1-phosphate uridylyltransferase